jgi:membrane protein DedA with SNARE-associated domain
LLGTFFGTRILQSRVFQKVFTLRKQKRVRAYFRKYGSKVIFVGRFLPGLRFSIFFSAGTLGVRPATFFIHDALAAILSVPALVYAAWYFGEHIDRVAAWARRSEYGILVIAGAAVLLIAFKAYRRRRTRTLPLTEMSSDVLPLQALQPPGGKAPEPRPRPLKPEA